MEREHCNLRFALAPQYRCRRPPGHDYGLHRNAAGLQEATVLWGDNECLPLWRCVDCGWTEDERCLTCPNCQCDGELMDLQREEDSHDGQG